MSLAVHFSASPVLRGRARGVCGLWSSRFVRGDAVTCRRCRALLGLDCPAAIRAGMQRQHPVAQHHLGTIAQLLRDGNVIGPDLQPNTRPQLFCQGKRGGAAIQSHA